jgi:hypothetical protein
MLSDFWAGASSQAGDLLLSLEGLGGNDRGWDVAQTIGRLSGLVTLPVRRSESDESDSLFTILGFRFAELSTMPLRWRPLGRCAASWITSERVSGGEPSPGIPPTLQS